MRILRRIEGLNGSGPSETALQKYLGALTRLASALVLVGLSIGPIALAQDPTPKADRRPKERASTATAESSAPIQPPVGYTVGVDDELTISVWHEPEFSQSVVVRSDGMVTLPLLNDIKVVGLSTEELRTLLTDKLKTVVNDPQVTIIVKAIRSLKVFLVGSVGKQGMFPLTSGLTVLQLITEGGGLGPFAKSGSIYILRTVNSKQVRIGFNYKKALQGKGADPLLQSGDMVVVP
jgi:polysaccharide export outer membrane protein